MYGGSESDRDFGLTTPGFFKNGKIDYTGAKTDLEAETRNINPGSEEIYTEIEVTYYQSLLRKKSTIYNDPEYLREFHQKAMNTIAVLNRNMIMCDVSFENIFKNYKEVNK
jgi:hypothetical protein